MSHNMQLSALKSGICTGEMQGTGNLGHEPIFFKIGNVSHDF